MDKYLKILTFLSKHDNGKFIEITHLSDDFKLLYNKTIELKKKGLIVIKSAGVFLLASGGQSTVIGDKENLKKILAKITLSGHEYLHTNSDIKNQSLLRFDNINTKKQANQPMETPNIKTTIGGWLLKYWWGFIIPIIIVIIGLIIENYYFKN